MDWRPRSWTDEELEAHRARSLSALNEAAMDLERSAATYEAAVDEARPLVEELFDRSDGLTTLRVGTLRASPAMLSIARFLASPPLSHDNLKRLIGMSLSRTRLADEAAGRALDIILAALDSTRFPWIVEERLPTAGEREAAMLATLTLLATERTRTLQRNDARRLELMASQALEEGGLTLASGRFLNLPWGLPPGTYSHERRVAGTNCDRPAHVREHELAFLIECKGSSTEINGTKRLKSIKEAAATWRRSFGNQVLTIAVISGAFKLEDLRATQEDGVFIVWEHDLTSLAELTRRATAG